MPTPVDRTVAPSESATRHDVGVTQGSVVPRRSQARELGVDLARGAAIISMFVAHTAPSAGPGGVFQLSEFLTFPLFALLVGAGAELAARRQSPRVHFVGSVVRAIALLGLGWWLAQSAAMVIIVLAPLGVLTLLCWGISRAPSRWVAAVALVAAAWAPWTINNSRGLWFDVVSSGDSTQRWWLELVISTAYPQAVLVLMAGVGILLTRLLLPRERPKPSVWIPAGITLAAVLATGAMIVARLLGHLDFLAYQTTWTEQLFVVVLATAVYAGCLTFASLPVANLALPLAWVGAMTLTLYSLHVGWLAWWVDLYPGRSDDTWLNVIGMSVVAIGVASAWRGLRLPPVWRRGPLEGLVGVGITIATRLFGGLPPEDVGEVSLRQTSRPDAEVRR